MTETPLDALNIIDDIAVYTEDGDLDFAALERDLRAMYAGDYAAADSVWQMADALDNARYVMAQADAYRDMTAETIRVMRVSPVWMI